VNQAEPLPPLDLRRTKCPLNFVKAKLAAEKLEPHQRLEVWLAPDSDSTFNVPNSLRQEGFLVEVTLREASKLTLYIAKRRDT